MNNIQTQLIRPLSQWQHYIGRSYTIERFLREAKQQGVSRRVPAQTARGMRFGDRVTLLRWNWQGNEGAFAFAEMEIVGITLDAALSERVAKRLIEQGVKVECGGGGGSVERECGNYIIAITCTVTGIDIPDIIAVATEVAQGEKLFVMISGRLVNSYAPVAVEPSPPFTRSFIRCQGAALVDTCQPAGDMIGITGYRRA